MVLEEHSKILVVAEMPSRLNNVAENKRVMIIIENAIKFANTDAGPITKILKIILEEFYPKYSR